MRCRANALQQGIANRFIRGGVNGARTRVVALGRATYVGEDTNKHARKRTKENVFLSIWCQQMTWVVSPEKPQRDLESVQFRLRLSGPMSPACPAAHVLAKTGHIMPIMLSAHDPRKGLGQVVKLEISQKTGTATQTANL